MPPPPLASPAAVTRARPLLPALVGLAVAGGACAQDDLSEQDYFNPLPQVLTVSRLAQPLSDTPGAVTIIDRKTLQDFNVRDMADILRLAPGFYVSGYNGANPIAVYHAPIDEGGVRNLVLIDGRPAYSTYYFGGTMRGLMTVDAEDVERVEILRGSNSAAYGANALFGVVNIVTRHSADSVGAQVSTRLGQGGLRDGRVSLGRGDQTASWRVSASQRADNGLEGLFDSRTLRQIRLRADARPSARDELQLDVGVSELRSGEGYAGNLDNPTRTLDWRDWHINGQWRRQRSDNEELKFSFSLTQENLKDAFDRLLPNPLPPVRVDFSGIGRRLDLELQHQFAVGDNTRLVWGGGLKVDESVSQALYSRPDGISVSEKRLFGNLEWRLAPGWLLNAGLFLGHHSWVGAYASPRLMLNVQPAPDHTLRVGVSRAVRTPSLFELAADTRYDTPLGLIQTNAARGGVQAERLLSQELGYLYTDQAHRVSLDVRVFREILQDRVVPARYGPVQALGIQRLDFVNLAGGEFRGVEYQLRWSPQPRTDLWLSQSFTDAVWYDNNIAVQPPDHATTVAVTHEWANRLRLSLMLTQRAEMGWRGIGRPMPAYRQVDLHLAYPFRVGTTPVRAALTVRSLNGAQQLFTSGFATPSSRRQAYASLHVEF